MAHDFESFSLEPEWQHPNQQGGRPSGALSDRTRKSSNTGPSAVLSVNVGGTLRAQRAS